MSELHQAQHTLAEARSHLQQGHAGMLEAASVLEPVSEILRGTLTQIQNHRDLFPLLGEIADTMLSYVSLTERLINQFGQIKGELYSAGLRTPVPGAPAPLPELSDQPPDQPGEDVDPNDRGDTDR